MPEMTYTFHIRVHQVDIRVDGEGVCWKANVEDDDPKVNPAKVLHCQLSVWLCRVFDCNASLWPFGLNLYECWVEQVG